MIEFLGLLLFLLLIANVVVGTTLLILFVLERHKEFLKWGLICFGFGVLGILYFLLVEVRVQDNVN